MATTDKRYSAVKSKLFAKLNWFVGTSADIKADVFSRYGAEKKVPEPIFMALGANLTSTIHMAKAVLKYAPKFYREQEFELKPEWFANASDNAKAIAKLKSKLATLKAGYTSAIQALEMAKTIPALKDNKAFIKMQKAQIKTYEAVETQIAGISGTGEDNEQAFTPNGFIMAFLAYTAWMNEEEVPSEVMSHAKNASAWKGQTESSFKLWLIEHPEEVYENVFEPLGVDFTVEELVDAVETTA